MILSEELLWWISAIDLPAMGALFWLIWKTRKDSHEITAHLRDVLETRHSQMREALAAFKLEVAKNYASITNMKELEVRLVSHLLRIEAKLDKTAMKAEALAAQKKNRK